MTDAPAETIKTGSGPDFSDSVALSFGDRAQQVFGIARVGLLPNRGKATAMTMVFERGEIVAGLVEGGVESRFDDWSEVTVAGLTVATVEPDSSWRASLAIKECKFDLQFEALTGALRLDDGADELGAMHQLVHGCRVTGTVTIGDRTVKIDGSGDSTRSWGATDWERLDSTRTLSAVFDDDLTVALQSIRASGASGHDLDTVVAYAAEPDREPRKFERALLSTAYDGDRRQHTAGAELHGAGEEYPQRLSGSVICGTSLDLGGLQLNLAFFDWALDGRTGIGRFDILLSKSERR